VKARRKPGRGGESHEHASSETGGGLLEIPRVPSESAARDRGREHSAMEGALVRRKLLSLTRRRKKAGLATRSEGDAASRPDPRRVVTEGVRGDVAGSVRGRKHRDREVQRGGAIDRGPTRTVLCRSRGRAGQSPRNVLSGRPFGGSREIAAQAEAGSSPSSEAPPGRLIRQRGRQAPEPRRRQAQAQGESAHRLVRRKTHGGHEPPKGGA